LPHFLEQLVSSFVVVVVVTVVVVVCVVVVVVGGLVGLLIFGSQVQVL